MTTDTENVSEVEFCKKMVAKYRDLLLANAGLQSISIDGQSVSYADLEQSYETWQKKLGRADGTKPAIRTISLRNT